MIFHIISAYEVPIELVSDEIGWKPIGFGR